MCKCAAAPATERSPVASRIPLLRSGERWKSQRVEGVARERLPVGRADVQVRGKGQAPGSAAVGTREGMPMGRVDV